MKSKSCLILRLVLILSITSCGPRFAQEPKVTDTDIEYDFSSSAMPDEFHVAAAPLPSQERSEYCSKANDPDSFKEKIYRYENLLSFDNQGGVVGDKGGLCWWHTNFQRSALYLAVYKPDLPKPTKKEVDKMLDGIIRRNGVIEIPGYSDLDSFSREWEEAIQGKLTHWARIDMLKFKWLHTLFGKETLKPKALEKRMDELFDKVERQKHIVWVMLPLKWYSAHAWLVINMEKTDSGYNLNVLDSNYSKYPYVVGYRKGDTSVELEHFRTAPAIDRENEFGDYQKAIQRYCGQ